MKNLAIDVGFGKTKGMVADKKVAIPSLLSNFQPISFIGMSEKSDIEQLAYSYNGDRYYVGDLAIRHGIPMGSLSANRTVETEGIIFFLVMVDLLSDEQNHNAVVGLPVNEYNRLRGAYKKALKGEHTLSRLYLSGTIKERKTFHINDVRVIPQPFGAYLNKLLGIGVDKSWYASNIGVIDIGHYTVDLARISEMEFHSESSVSYSDVGVSNVYQSVSKGIQTTYGIQVLPEKLEEIIISKKLRIKGQDHNIQNIVSGSVSQTAQAIVNRVNNVWQGCVDLDRILITGGGGPLLGNYIKRLLDHDYIEICDRGVYGNVEGYQKYAQKIWG